jgi:hypothetical protein
MGLKDESLEIARINTLIIHNQYKRAFNKMAKRILLVAFLIVAAF